MKKRFVTGMVGLGCIAAPITLHLAGLFVIEGLAALVATGVFCSGAWLVIRSSESH